MFAREMKLAKMFFAGRLGHSVSEKEQPQLVSRLRAVLSGAHPSISGFAPRCAKFLYRKNRSSVRTAGFALARS
jgi:hypothetical protein